jgi:hypothetical protein
VVHAGPMQLVSPCCDDAKQTRGHRGEGVQLTDHAIILLKSGVSAAGEVRR